MSRLRDWVQDLCLGVQAKQQETDRLLHDGAEGVERALAWFKQDMQPESLRSHDTLSTESADGKSGRLSARPQRCQGTAIAGNGQGWRTEMDWRMSGVGSRVGPTTLPVMVTEMVMVMVMVMVVVVVVVMVW